MKNNKFAKYLPKSRVKITHENQPCRKCGTPVVKRIPRRGDYAHEERESKQKAYYYEWYLFCPGCGTFYYVNEAKRFYDNIDLSDRVKFLENSKRTSELMISKGFRSVFELTTDHVKGSVWTVWVNLSTGRSVMTTVSSNETIYHDVIETTPERL